MKGYDAACLTRLKNGMNFVFLVFELETGPPRTKQNVGHHHIRV